MLLFILGVVEMFVVAYWTKTVAESRVISSGFITVVNVMIWYYVLRVFVDDINNWYLVLAYAFGCAVGTMLSGYVSNIETAKRRARKGKQALIGLEKQSLVTE